MSRLFYARKKLQFILRPIYDQIYETPRPSASTARLIEQGSQLQRKQFEYERRVMFDLHYREILGHASYIFCTSFFSTPARSALSEANRFSLQNRSAENPS
jgi:hypothetical protein